MPVARDARTAFTYLNNRYYDPALGVFLSVDPLVSKPGQGACQTPEGPTPLCRYAMLAYPVVGVLGVRPFTCSCVHVLYPLIISWATADASPLTRQRARALAGILKTQMSNWIFCE